MFRVELGADLPNFSHDGILLSQPLGRFLALPQSLLRAFAFGDVEDHSHNAGDGALRVSKTALWIITSRTV